MNQRRKLLIACGAGLAAASTHGLGQQRVFRVAYLSAQSVNSNSAIAFQTIKKRLSELGYAERANIAFDSRWAEGDTSRLPALAAELMALNPDVLMASATLAIRAAQQATGSIPIVMSPATDPVGSGFVKSLARPGGNITGVANLYIDTSSKLIELLHSLAPKARRFGVLTMPRNPTHATQLAEAMIAFKTLKLSGMPFSATNGEEIDQAFAAMARQNIRALVVMQEPLFLAQSQRIADLTVKYRLPAIFQSSPNVEAGGLVSYGANLGVLNRMAAGYVDKLLKGTKPEDLPVEQPTRLEMVVNGKAAKALGLKIPESILLRADRVIE